MHLLNFYVFFTIDEPYVFAAHWREQAAALNLLGTLLIASEGANVSLCGERADLEKFGAAFAAIAPLDQAHLKWHSLDAPAFGRLVARVKPELIKTSWPADAALNQGAYLSPAEVNALLEDPDTLFVDMRNRYESEVGAFRGALHMPLDEFHELPEKLVALAPYRHRRLITYCTGGIRCEKSTPLLRQHGFERVFQIHGGILRYLEEYPDGAWEGECFVFDQRVTVNRQLRTGSYNLCSGCGKAAPKPATLCADCQQRRAAGE